MINAVVLTTGPLVTLDQAKAHLRVDGDDEDALIETYADAAVRSCLKNTDRELVPQDAEAVFRAAALLTLGDFYANRESVVAGQSFGLSPTAEMLLGPYRLIRV